MNNILFFSKRPVIYFLLLFILLFNTSYSQNLDINLLRNFNQKRNIKLDNTYKVVTNSVMPIGIGLPMGLFATGLINKDKVARNNGIEVGGSFILASCFTYGLKIGVNRPRPYITYPEIQKVEGHGFFSPSSGPYSFPSGHTSAAFATATSLSLCYPKWYVIAPSFTWACFAGYSRMHLGFHYPSDVLTGALIGVGSALLMHQGAKWMEKKYVN